MDHFLVCGAAMNKRGEIVPVEFEDYERSSEISDLAGDRIMFRLVCAARGLEPMEIFEREYFDPNYLDPI